MNTPFGPSGFSGLAGSTGPSGFGSLMGRSSHTAGVAAPIGIPVPRVDGRDKVTGAARYAAEHPAEDLLFGVVVASTIARGRIRTIDTHLARAVPGVVEVLTHRNRPPMARFDLLHKDMDAPRGSPFRPLYDAEVHSNAQPIALVVAVSFEAARHASRLLRIEYDEADMPPRSDMDALQPKSGKPKRAASRGDADAAFAEAPVKVEAHYHSPAEFHNPMETHASTAIWEGEGRLTVYDKTQGAQNSRAYLARVLKLRKGNVRVLCPYVGGAFGSALRPGYQLVLAAMAALKLQRSVRVVLTRQQMFSFGHRPETAQALQLSCDTRGRLLSIAHEATSETSRREDYGENIVGWAAVLYDVPNLRVGQRVTELDRFTPTDMRAPGAAQGVFALETAMDELAAEVGIDPLQLRLVNYADRVAGKADAPGRASHGKPFTSKALRECFLQGAASFGWQRRSAEPRSMRDGHTLIGWGMATGVWEAMQLHGSARAVLRLDGSLEVSSATTDIGTGTYTVMTQIASATLGIPMPRVNFRLGDSSLPMAPIEGGSFTVATIGTAVQAVCQKVAAKLLVMARAQGDTPLHQARLKDVEFVNGLIRLRDDPVRSISIRELMQRADVREIDCKSLTLPNVLNLRRYARATHSAVFAEVRVDEALGTVHVSRVVSAVAAGRIVNPLTAASQIQGGVVWGIGMALHEEGLFDHARGRLMNHSFGEYHVPANADIGSIDVIFVDEPDRAINPLGVKGVGEIGLVGVAAAVGNAIFHATGQRLRSLPFTPDKLIQPP